MWLTWYFLTFTKCIWLPVCLKISTTSHVIIDMYGDAYNNNRNSYVIIFKTIDNMNDL